MSFRSVVVKERCKLEYSLNYLICRKGLEESRIFIDEIKNLIIESTQVCITSALLVVLSKKKIKVIFCNETHNPECELVSYQNNYYSYRKIKEQLLFVKNNEQIWKLIVKEKILCQAKVLLLANKEDEYKMLQEYASNVENNDITNREGHSAKVYFNALFGTSFNRNQDNNINKYLNYGYSILLSTINREIKALGYLTEIGIHHIGESNPFNLSCDLIEPLRPLVDSYVVKNLLDEDNYRIKLISMLSTVVTYKDQSILLENAIPLYIIDVIKALKDNVPIISFIKYEL